MSATDGHDHAGGGGVGTASLGALTLGAIGVVFGDIGTSPLYAFREALNQSGTDGIDASEVLGVLSLALWALIIVVTVKYVLFLMRMDNGGEGGVLSLMALARRTGKAGRIVLWLGAAGAALFYGDAIITPALSVLSAVEGMRTIPSLATSLSEHTVVLITGVILIGLFVAQSRGTATVAKLFGPVCVAWFLAIGALGATATARVPQVLGAINPGAGAQFLLTHGTLSFFVLGAVFLTVTGAEALTADMGHFGLKPIRIGWFVLAFPTLVLNYFGQGALALAAIAAGGHATTANADWFFLLSPEALRPALVVLATLATIIASQAVITGAFSLTQQAVALSLLPRLTIRQTSEHHAGQIYIPVINWLLLAGVLLLIQQFRNSSDMAAAYGIAVTGTMVITTALAFIVVRRLRRWSLALSLAAIVPLMTIDLIFFGANILRVVEGGWVPLLVAALIGLVIATWRRGRALVDEETRSDTVPTVDLVRALAARPPVLVDGLAVFVTRDPHVAPVALLHNLKHTRVLHRHNILLGFVVATRPRVPEEERLMVRDLAPGFREAILRYGYMEQPDAPRDLFGPGRIAKAEGGTSFFIGRDSVGANRHGGMPYIQDLLFIFLSRNAADPMVFLGVPPRQVVEMGTRLHV